MSDTDVDLWRKLGVKSGFEKLWARWLSRICKDIVLQYQVESWRQKKWPNKTAMWEDGDALDAMQNNILNAIDELNKKSESHFWRNFVRNWWSKETSGLMTNANPYFVEM